jgi:hypothetical protein
MVSVMGLPLHIVSVMGLPVHIVSVRGQAPVHIVTVMRGRLVHIVSVGGKVLAHVAMGKAFGGRGGRSGEGSGGRTLMVQGLVVQERAVRRRVFRGSVIQRLVVRRRSWGVRDRAGWPLRGRRAGHFDRLRGDSAVSVAIRR